MARTRSQVQNITLPDAAPPGTVVTLRAEEGGWSALVEVPLPGGGVLTQPVRVSDVNATKGNRAATCIEDLYDRAVALAGFAQV